MIITVVTNENEDGDSGIQFITIENKFNNNIIN